MIYVILWILIGWATMAYWIWYDATKQREVFNLKLLIGCTLMATFLGPILVGFFIHEKYKDQINEFFEKPIIGGK